MSAAPDPPSVCSVAFKEWAGVCDALGDGRQVVILRKGGISEGPGPGEFRPEHDAFWLYPTHLHEAQQGLRDEARAGDRAVAEGVVPIRVLVVVAGLWWVDRAERLDALAGFHTWTDETVRHRFAYRRPGLWALAVRAFRLPEPWPVAERPEYAGCRTWVELGDPPPTAGLAPVLDEAAFADRMGRLGRALEGSPGGGPRDG